MVKAAWAGPRLPSTWMSVIDERDNLDLLSGVLVEKVIVENGRATGVQFRQGGESRIARCRGDRLFG